MRLPPEAAVDSSFGGRYANFAPKSLRTLHLLVAVDSTRVELASYLKMLSLLLLRLD